MVDIDWVYMELRQIHYMCGFSDDFRLCYKALLRINLQQTIDWE